MHKMRTLTLCAACADKYADAYHVKQVSGQHYGKCAECPAKTVALYEVGKR